MFLLFYFFLHRSSRIICAAFILCHFLLHFRWRFWKNSDNFFVIHVFFCFLILVKEFALILKGFLPSSFEARFSSWFSCLFFRLPGWFLVSGVVAIAYPHMASELSPRPLEIWFSVLGLGLPGCCSSHEVGICRILMSIDVNFGNH